MSNKEALKVLEEWFAKVEPEEELDAETVWELFEGDYLPWFDVVPNRCKYPDWSLRKENEEQYNLEYEAYRTDHNRETEERQIRLLETGYEHMMQEGGGEGGAEDCQGVIRIGEQYIKADWSYYSYNGCEYDYIKDTLRFVKPVEKTITVYENI